MVKSKARSAAKTPRKSDKHAVTKARPAAKKAAGQAANGTIEASKPAAHLQNGSPVANAPADAPLIAAQAISSFKSSSGVDLTEKVKELLRLAQEQGYLTYNDINDALPDNIVSPEELDEIYIKLRNLEVELVDQAEVDRVKPREPEEEG